MAKRFIDTTIWTQNKWFRKLKPEIKLLWIYLFTNCDSVGIWEEDIELASFVIGYAYTMDSLLEFKGKLKQINEKKYWIIDFCNFQYGILDDEKLTNKPHQSYIRILKNHSLWIDYLKTIHSLKEKDKEKDKEKYIKIFDEIKDEFSLSNEYVNLITLWLKYKSEKGQSYKKTGLKTLIESLLKDSKNDIEIAREMINKSIRNNYSGIFKIDNNQKKQTKNINDKWI
ncbi:MAG: hypothetical protein OEV44_00115 [Spirochaetota bacterium]|nr:hypothetical protein [Spirochaetota bacterium]